MKNFVLSSIHNVTNSHLTIIVFFSITTACCRPCRAQIISQPAQIAWGRYFDDTVPGSHFDKEDIGDRIYYYDNNVYFVGRSKSDSLYPVPEGKTCTNVDGDAFVACY